MIRVESMKDVNGEVVKVGDFVQLTEGKASYINGAMKKGFVFKIAYIENRKMGKTDYYVAFLTSKNGKGRIYNSGCTSTEIRKVNYDLKKKKIIQEVKENEKQITENQKEKNQKEIAMGIIKELKKKGFNDEDILFKQREGWESQKNKELNKIDYEVIERWLKESKGNNSKKTQIIIKKSTKEELEEELDYELLMLNHAIIDQDEKEKEKITKRLKEIHKELGL